MFTTLIKAISLAGILLVLILYISKVSKIKKTEEGQENLSFGKKNVIFNSFTALIANFLNVEGIGTHAVNVVAFKMGKTVNVGDLPGTLNIGAAVPACLAAFLFFPETEIDAVTLLSLIFAALIGAFLGAKLITKLNTMGVRLLLGVGLLILGAIMIVRFFKPAALSFPEASIKLGGIQLVIGILCSLIFGALTNIGVGFYAPCLAFCSLLGLNFDSSMAIMYAGTAVMLAFGCAPQMIKSGKFDIIACAAQFVLGSAGVLVAHFFIKSIHISIISLVVAFAVILTGVLFITDYKKNMNKMR